MLFALINSLFILADQKYTACKRAIKYGCDIISQLLAVLSMPMRLKTEMSEVHWFLEQTFPGIAKKFWMLRVPFLELSSGKFLTDILLGWILGNSKTPGSCGVY